MFFESHASFHVALKVLDIWDGGVLVIRVYAVEVFRSEAAVDVLTKVSRSKVVCLKLFYMVYCFV